MKRKAQGALEFLTTYGWAFLVILIMIGALGYFGILNPTRFLPERCNVNSEFACDETSLVENSGAINFSIVLRNSLGQAIGVNTAKGDVVLTSDLFGGSISTSNSTKVDCTFKNSNTDKTPDTDGVPLNELAVAIDESFLVNCDIKSAAIKLSLPATGNKIKIAYNFKYVPLGRTLEKAITGEVFGSLQ